MDIVRIIFFAIIGVVVLLLIWSVLMKKGEEAKVANEAEKKVFQNRVRRPTQAQILPGELVKIVENDMIHNEPKTYTFYYKLEAHKIGISMYNNKYIIMLDDQIYPTYSEVMGKGTVHNSRFASISEKFTVTEVVEQLTNRKLLIENMDVFKNHLVEDTSTNYNNQVEFKEE